jgi:hypothetical protein
MTCIRGTIKYNYKTFCFSNFLNNIYILLLLLTNVSIHFVYYVQYNDYEFSHIEYAEYALALLDQILQSFQLDLKNFHYFLFFIDLFILSYKCRIILTKILYYTNNSQRYFFLMIFLSVNLFFDIFINCFIF